MRKIFFTGLVTLIPLAITVWVFSFFVRFLTRPFLGLMAYLLDSFPSLRATLSTTFFRYLSESLILLSLFLITLALGFVARRFFFKKVLQWGDLIVGRIPLVNRVYKTSKEIVRSFFASQKKVFSQVVLLSFPHQRSRCLGLVASPSPETCREKRGDSLVTVFIPTTPNPTTGYLIMIPQEELIYLKMTSEDAIKYIVSCATIQPAQGAS